MMTAKTIIKNIQSDLSTKELPSQVIQRVMDTMVINQVENNNGDIRDAYIKLYFLRDHFETLESK